jgi:membrane protein YqaA with SNARE-associated domain
VIGELLLTGEVAGLWGLFLACFLAATIVPFSSEAMLAAATFGPWSNGTLILVASLGNWLGGLTTYLLGRLGSAPLMRRLRLDPSTADRWQGPVRRHGSWLALLCWAPIVGDVIALALGLFRVHAAPVALLMLAGKAARYALVIAALR